MNLGPPAMGVARGLAPVVAVDGIASVSLVALQSVVWKRLEGGAPGAARTAEAQARRVARKDASIAKERGG